MNTVRKDTTAEVYRIRTAGHEWATIVLFGWQGTGVDKQQRECGEILIHSSFGSWANSWGHLGQPFKSFLLQAERDYVGSKFMNERAYEFDGEKTMRDLRQRLIEWRKQGELKKEDARSLWDHLQENEDILTSSDHEFIGGMEIARAELVPSRQLLRFLEEPWEYMSMSLNRCFAGFWREVWPVFLEQLKAEQAEVPA